MKKLLVSLIIITMLVLSACGQVEKENNETKDDSSGIVTDNDDIDFVKYENDSKEDEEIETNEEDNEDYDYNDLLIDKNIGEYKFDDFESKTKEVLDYDFEAYCAIYSFKNGNTFAEACVMPLSINSYDLINNLEDSDNVEFLDNEDFNFLEFDVFYVPRKNNYYWISKDNLISVSNSIGFDILEEYLEDYPTSVITGSYDSDEKIIIDFEDEDEEKIVVIDGKQYVISITDFSERDQEIVVEVNDESEIIKKNDEAIIGNLLIDIRSVDFDDEDVEIEIKQEVTAQKEILIEKGSSELIIIDDENIVLELVGGNANTETVIIEFNGKVKNLEVDETEDIDDFSIKLKEFFINNIGEESLSANFLIWKTD